MFLCRDGCKWGRDLRECHAFCGKFYLHWVYIVIVIGLFARLCFGFASELAGTSSLGRLRSGFMAGFWLLRIGLQGFYYDSEVRRVNKVLDVLYLTSLTALVVIFGWAAAYPVR
jgi:hypothetical protein